MEDHSVLEDLMDGEMVYHSVAKDFTMRWGLFDGRIGEEARKGCIR
jgi:hypothetical protein